MPKFTDCPDCEKTFKGEKCPTCGWSASNGPDDGPRDYACAYRTQPIGLRCLMSGEVQTQSKAPILCGWHGYPRNYRTIDNLEEFERWVTHQLEHYCGQFSHDRATDLWAALRGEKTLPTGGHPCADPACRFRAITTSTGHRSPIEYARAVQALIAQTAATLTPDKEPRL